MAADVELLPLPESDEDVPLTGVWNGSPRSGSVPCWFRESVEAAIRANVAHATAALNTEIEALRDRNETILRAFMEREAALIRRAQKAEAEIEVLRAEVERLMTIAGWGGLASDAPDRLILASEMFDDIASCDKWLTVRRIGDGDQPFPESATAYVRADIAEQAEARVEQLAEALREAYGQVRELCNAHVHPYPEASFARYEAALNPTT